MKQPSLLDNLTPARDTHEEVLSMPPPKRKPVVKADDQPREDAPGRKRPGMSVYLDPAIAVPLGGFGSKIFQAACWCWAHVIEQATIKVAPLFSGGEWHLLALCVLGREDDFDPALDNPGANLAALVDRGVHLGITKVLGAKSEEKVADLASRLRALDYPSAWAVIWALRYRAELDISPSRADWWTLAHRQEHALELVPPRYRPSGQ